jgi:hypothetical protein
MSDKPRSVFIICDAGSNIRPLIETFEGLGLRTLNAEDAFAPSASIVGSTQELITRADVGLRFSATR